MKKTTNISKQQSNIFLFTFLAFILLGAISCEDEIEEPMPDYELIVPPDAYSFNVTSVSNNDEVTVYAEPFFTSNLDALGCSVHKVSYYIDNKFISTETSSPFRLEFKTDLLLKGEHVLKAVFTVGGKGFKDAMVEGLSAFNVGEEAVWRPAVRFSFEYDTYLRVGDNVHVTLKMIDKYSAGYKIREVKYHLDGKLVSTATEAPYTLDYSPTLVVGQWYTLHADVSYTLGGKYIGSYGLTATIIVLADEETRYVFNSDYPYNAHFYNGEVISGTGILYRGIGDDITYEFNAYWDGELVGSSKTFPYKFNYIIQNASKGVHKLEYEWQQYDKNGKYKGGQRQIENIIVE